MNTPPAVLETAVVLAFYVFPGLFVAVSVIMWGARVRHAPYFAFFCAFAALGTLSLCIAAGNNPLGVLSFLIAYPVCISLMLINIRRSRSRPERSAFHHAAEWTSILSITIIVFLLVCPF